MRRIDKRFGCCAIGKVLWTPLGKLNNRICAELKAIGKSNLDVLAELLDKDLFASETGGVFELQPNTKVKVTRPIMRDWGQAMATLITLFFRLSNPWAERFF